MKTGKIQGLFPVLFSVILFFMFIPLGDFSSNAQGAEFSGGSGMESDPYLVETVDDLNRVRENLSACYKLVNDIVFTEQDFQNGGWMPIGTSQSPFTGTFDGNGYVIENLCIDLESSSDISVGLFGCMMGGTIQNLGLKNLNISVTNASPSSDIYLGSIVGWSYSSRVINCYSDGRLSVTSSGAVIGGGIVGMMWGSYAETSECYFSGSLNISSWDNATAGGIVGSMSGNTSLVQNCFNLGYVHADGSASSYVGGIVGKCTAGTIRNVYNVGILSGSVSGGVLGSLNEGSVENSYYLDSLVTSVGQGEDVGQKCSWDEMKFKDTFTEFDFNSIWDLDPSAEYPCPILRNLPVPVWDFEGNFTEFSGGTGVPWDPYLIETKEHLNHVRNYLNAHFKLIGDIYFSDDDFAENGAYDHSGAGWNPIGSSVVPFSGYFDGNGHVIENLQLSVRDTFEISAGLFGYSTGIIQNLGVVNSTVSAESTTSDAFAGGIAGWSSGQIRNCYFTGNIFGSTTGGIVGFLSNGLVEQSFSIGNFNGVLESGGIAGIVSDGIVRDCYCGGDVVSATGKLGGIVGSSFGDVLNCYYLEKNSVGVGFGTDLCTKCTYAEMMQASTFSDFDFQTVWTMKGDENYFYPELQSVKMKFEKKIISIEILTKPTKLTYLEGETFDASGMVVAYRYNNGQSEIINDFEISGYSDLPGTKTITVSKNGLTSTFPVTVLNKSLVSISLSSLPEKMVYIEGETFDGSGMVVTAHFNNNTHEAVSDYVLSGYTSTVGEKTIFVSYRGITTSFTVTVTEKSVISIAVTQMPSKLIYLEGDSFKKTGMVVTANYNNGTSKNVTDYEISGYSSTPGTKTISVTYAGKSTTFSVVVNAKELTAIKVLKKPDKYTYIEGQSFDIIGIIVKAYYNNDTSEEITDFAYSGYTSTPGIKTITVTYNDVSTTFTVTVSEKSLSSIEVTTLPTKTDYLEGDELDSSGMVVTAYFNNGTSQIITDYTTRGFSSTPGTKEITVSYNRKTARFTVTVRQKTLTSIAVTKLPNKLVYIEGDSFNKDGMVVMGYYNNGVALKITNYTISNDFSSAGEQKVTVSYGGKSSFFTVLVKAKIPLTITSNKYGVGDEIIRKIPLETSVTMLLSNLNEGVFCKVFQGKTEVSKETLIGTGMKVKIFDGDSVKKTYTTIVTGDLNGDGIVSITDLLSLKSHLLKKSTLKDAYLVAADTNCDDTVSITDFLKIKAKILKKGDITPG